VAIAFSAPVTNIQFGMQVSTFSAVPTMATVALYNNSATPFTTIPLGSSLSDPFAEGQFTYSGGPVTNILITPQGGPGITAFSLDNLTVVSSPPPVPPESTVPAVSPLALAVTAVLLLGLSMLVLRRRPA